MVGKTWGFQAHVWRRDVDEDEPTENWKAKSLHFFLFQTFTVEGIPSSAKLHVISSVRSKIFYTHTHTRAR